MDTAKERARRTLIRRINDLHDFSQVSEMIHEAIEDIWNIFENDLVEELEHGKEINENKGKKDIKRWINKGQEVDAKAERIIWCKSK